MNGKNILIVTGAALAAYLLLRQFGGGSGSGNLDAGQRWVSEQGNTGFPDAARTGAVFI